MTYSTVDLGHAQDWTRMARGVTSEAHLAHDMAFGQFLTDHDGQRIGVTYEQHGVERTVEGELLLTLTSAYSIGGVWFDPAASSAEPRFEGYPVRWTTLA